MAKLLAPILTLYLGAFSVACSATTASTPAATDSGPPVADDADAYYAQFCAAFGACCKTTGGGAQCASMLAGSQTWNYDPARGARCLGDLRALGNGVCADDFQFPASCTSVFQDSGTAKPGEPCSVSRDCAASAEGDVRCSGGSCQVQVVGKVGDTPCASIDGAVTLPRVYVCDAPSGAFCEGATKTCKARGAVGALCSGAIAYECGDGSYCDVAAKTCVASKALGAACGGHVECVRGAYCATTCTAQQAAGTACTDSVACKSLECSFSTKKCGPNGIVEAVCGT